MTNLFSGSNNCYGKGYTKVCIYNEMSIQLPHQGKSFSRNNKSLEVFRNIEKDCWNINSNQNEIIISHFGNEIDLLEYRWSDDDE